METFTILPKVDEIQEFIEIANDFSNPLDIVREAISNSYDAQATNIEISFDVIKPYGEKVLQIKIIDNGIGMDAEGLHAFFDLGNSFSRDYENKIGEKGHGTKVYFNSSKIIVITTQEGTTYKATMNNPIRGFYERAIPEVIVEKETSSKRQNGTEITILGYNNNRREKFNHEQLRDYILWFTKFGSCEKYFGIEKNTGSKLILKGLGKQEPETIIFGHSFPDESKSVQDLFEQYLIVASDFYCKRIIKIGTLRNFPEVKYQTIFSIEGNKIKQDHNPMIRQQGKPRCAGDYTVQDRYGIWLCKDFIPVERKNEWITSKGYEYTKFHAFINCQEFKLTANRGSVDNTPAEIMDDINFEVKKIYDEIVDSKDWRELDWLESEVGAYKTAEKEKKDFDWRKSKILNSNIAHYKDHVLVEPQRESGVFALAIQLNMLEPDFFPFNILDYDTHSGLDVIAKADNTIPITSASIYHVEFKFILTSVFNHSFQDLFSIVCWDAKLKNDEIVTDINNEARRFQIIQPSNDKEYTTYYLDNPKSNKKIEVFILKNYLRQKLNIDFRLKTEKDLF